MTAKISTYRRLPGKKKGFLVGNHTLWRGPDHLLQIYSRLGVEDYKRFYFEDIQAIITRKTDTGKIKNFIFGALSGLFGLLALTSEGGWFIFNAIMAGVMLIFLAINYLKGPTCETVLFTAVQAEKLYSLHRLKTTQPVMNGLRSLIEKKQGRIDRNTFYQPSARFTRNLAKGMPPGGNKNRLNTQKTEKGRVHLCLFALLIFDALVLAAGFLLNHVALTLLGTTVTMMLGICVIMALVKQYGSNLKSSLRAITWAALGYVCFSFLAGYIISMGIAFKNPELMQNQWELLKLISTTTPWQSAWMMTVNIAALCGAAVIGITGLFILRNPHQTIHNPSALPVNPAPNPAVKRIS